MHPRRAIVWFTSDLRLHDNPALTAALQTADEVIPAFIVPSRDSEPWNLGGASRTWLAHSLELLDSDLRDLGSQLVLRSGPVPETLRSLFDETGACALHFSRRYEPGTALREEELSEELCSRGIVVHRHESALLQPIASLSKNDGTPYRVFTPFFRAAKDATPPDPPLPRPEVIPGPANWPESESIASVFDLSADPRPELLEHWTPGEAGARARLAEFISHSLEDYVTGRDRPDLDGTSRVSPHLVFGEISAHEVLYSAWEARARDHQAPDSEGVSGFVRQLYWREFAYRLLHHFPHTAEKPLRPEFEAFPWEIDNRGWDAWCRGETGYPLVDAGMRQLLATGWMHGRVRMVVASFLTKDLLIPWLEGARWFWENLVDADLANNTLGWQWVAGSGADAAPYFRVFNPVAQGERFDPDGAYVRRWVPELEGLSAKWIHRPWEAPVEVLRVAGVELGATYPFPIVEHSEARQRALSAYHSIKRG